MQSSPYPWYLIPRKLKYLSEYPILEKPLSPFFSFGVRDRVLHSYVTKGKIMLLYILILTFLDSRLEGKIFCTEL